MHLINYYIVLWGLEDEKNKNMNTFAKVLVTIGVVFLFIIVFGAIVGARSDAGHSTPGILGLIMFGALVGALRTIWKKPKNILVIDVRNYKKN